MHWTAIYCCQVVAGVHDHSVPASYCCSPHCGQEGGRVCWCGHRRRCQWRAHRWTRRLHNVCMHVSMCTCKCMDVYETYNYNTPLYCSSSSAVGSCYKIESSLCLIYKFFHLPIDSHMPILGGVSPCSTSAWLLTVFLLTLRLKPRKLACTRYWKKNWPSTSRNT